MRIQRLDLNRGSGAQEKEKKIRPKGPRNPVTDDIQNKKEESGPSGKIYKILLLLVAAGLLYFVYNYVL